MCYHDLKCLIGMKFFSHVVKALEAAIGGVL